MEKASFRFRYQKDDKKFANSLIDILDKAADKIRTVFGFQKSVDCSVVICCNTSEFIKYTGKTKESYQSWMVGNSDSVKRTIYLLSPTAVTDCTEKDLLKIAVHELVHIIFDYELEVVDNESWLSEGIAILLAEQTDLRYVDANKCPLIADISGVCDNGETCDNFYDNGGYDYAGIYVWYFIEKFGAGNFIAAYKNEINANDLIYDGFEKEAVALFSLKKASL